MTKKSAISCIIPAFNEEKTVADVVETALSSELFKDIICINDGSQDQTLNILQSFGKKIKLIDLSRNHGKGAAMAAGIKKAQGEIVVFLDADLVDLEKRHLEQLINPLLKKRADVILGSLVKTNPLVKLTGERAYFRKDLLPCCRFLMKKRFETEIYLNDVFKDKKTKIVHLKGLKMLFKPQKMGFNQEMINAYLKEALEISQEIVRTQGKSVKDNLQLQREVIRKFLNKYLKRTKKIEKLLVKSKTFKKLEELLEF